MTAIEDARADLAERIKRMRAWQQFDVEDFRASDLEAVLTAAESTLATPPTDDDDRETLLEHMQWLVSLGVRRDHARDAVERLAAGFRRQGPIADEWEYGEQSKYGQQVWFVDRDNTAIWDDIPPEKRVRRRAPGPWEPVDTADG